MTLGHDGHLSDEQQATQWLARAAGCPFSTSGLIHCSDPTVTPLWVRSGALSCLAIVP